MKGLALGFSSIGKAFDLLRRHRVLWPYAVLPTLINLLLLLATLYLVIHHFPTIFGQIVSKISIFDIKTSSIWHGLLLPMLWIAKLFFFMVFMIFSLILCFILGMIISGPFNDILSEKTEKILRPNEKIIKISFFSSIARSIIIELQRSLIFVLLPVALLIVNLLPVVGAALYFILINLFAVFDIGFAFVDYPMGRRFWKFSKRLRFARRHKTAVAGLGLIGLIPFLVYFINAPMVVAGTILFVRLDVSRETR